MVTAVHRKHAHMCPARANVLVSMSLHALTTSSSQAPRSGVVGQSLRAQMHEHVFVFDQQQSDAGQQKQLHT